MKGRFNIPMTEYYVEGENTGEFMYPRPNISSLARKARVSFKENLYFSCKKFFCLYDNL